ncbi:MAG: hypothetical protein AB1502_16585 [Thermodesulfobacteriota bacterium]
MGLKSFFIFFIILLWFVFIPFSADAKDGTVTSRLSVCDGKTFTSVQDPEFLSYDQALRDYMVKRISNRFGIALDPKTYSGFDLLEIEGLFKCKKSNEPFDLFLKMFPKHP